MESAERGAVVGGGPEASAVGTPGRASGSAGGPAPGSRAGVLVAFRNELTKAVKRPGSWVTMGLFALLMGLATGGQLLQAGDGEGESFALPAAWGEILGPHTQLPLLFGSVLLVLLVASEFSWRTARQNVIDGLSRETWFWGKVALVPVLAVAFLAAHVLIGGGFALAGTASPDAAAVLPGGLGPLLGICFLAFLGYGALALATALAVRSTGGSVAAFIFYVVVAEQLLAGGLGRLGGIFAEVGSHLPVGIFRGLVQSGVAAFLSGGGGEGSPAGADPAELALWSAGWILALVGVSYLVFRRRDL